MITSLAIVLIILLSDFPSSPPVSVTFRTISIYFFVPSSMVFQFGLCCSHSLILSTCFLATAFSFMGIGFEVYGNYLLWFIALALFFAILPSQGGTLFN